MSSNKEKPKEKPMVSASPITPDPALQVTVLKDMMTETLSKAKPEKQESSSKKSEK